MANFWQLLRLLALEKRSESNFLKTRDTIEWWMLLCKEYLKFTMSSSQWSGSDLTLTRYTKFYYVPPIMCVMLLTASLVMQMVQIPQSPDCVYSFWIGIPEKTQIHILRLCAGCPSVQTIAVFQDRKWRNAEKGSRFKFCIINFCLHNPTAFRSYKNSGVVWKRWLGFEVCRNDQDVCIGWTACCMGLPAQLKTSWCATAATRRGAERAYKYCIFFMFL